MARIILLALVVIINSQKLFSQDVDWHKTTNWTIYQTKDRIAFNYSLDTLRYFKHVLLEKDSTQRLLADVTSISYDRTPVWMGAYTASCRLVDGTYRRIEISKYGGFFFDVSGKKYYELSISARTEWLNYLAASYSNITENK